MHGDDVSNEGTFLHWRDVSDGYPIGQRGLRTAGHHSTGTPVGNEDGLAGWTLITCAGVGDGGDVCQCVGWREAKMSWLEVVPGRGRGERSEEGESGHTC